MESFVVKLIVSDSIVVDNGVMLVILAIVEDASVATVVGG